MLNRFRKINRTYKNFNRFIEILSILAKYEFEDFLSRIGVLDYLKKAGDLWVNNKEQTSPVYSKYERLRMAFEELGTTFIKLGQVLSTRTDMFPPDLIDELKKLQGDVTPFSKKEVYNIIALETGSEIKDLFKSFEDKCISSASVAQVHKAVTHDDKIVAVKIQRPEIDKIVRADLEIIYFLATLIEKYLEEYRFLKPVKIADYFSDIILKELDFYNEIENIEFFIKNFSDFENIKIPYVKRDMCTGKIIVMEYIEGIKLDYILKNENDYNKKQIALTGASFVFEQIFLKGYFHADPHPGNIIYGVDGKICFIDYGSCVRLTTEDRDILRDLIGALIEKNTKKMTSAVLRFEKAGKINRSQIEKEIEEFIFKYADRPIKEIDIRKVLDFVVSIVRKHRLILPPEFFMLIKALITIDAIARDLYPEFDLFSEIEPYARSLVWEKMNPLNIVKDFYKGVVNSAKVFKKMPLEIEDILILLKNGDLKIDMELKDQKKILNTLDIISNRIAFSIVLASLILGSSILVMSDIPPKIYDVPIIGIVGFIAAALIGIILIISILRSKMF